MSDIQGFKAQIEAHISIILDNSTILNAQKGKVKRIILNAYDSNYDDNDLDNILKGELCGDENKDDEIND
jgi:hypothetical protein